MPPRRFLSCTAPTCNSPHLARGYCVLHYQRWKKHGDVESGGRVRYSLERPEQLKNALLTRRDISSDSCWLWTMGRGERGYGQWTIKQKTYAVHRVAAHLFLEFNLDSPLLICHRCDNPPCFNPEHLFVGDHADNSVDMVVKKRSAMGAKNGQSKLDDEAVQDIRRRLSQGETQTAIAKAYGVTQPLIGFIDRGLAWKHVA